MRCIVPDILNCFETVSYLANLYPDSYQGYLQKLYQSFS